MPITRSIAKNLRPHDINYEGRLTRHTMKQIRNLEVPIEFKRNPEISSDSDESDESYIDFLEKKQLMEKCIKKCITFSNLSITNNFKQLYNELTMEDIEDEIIREYFNEICNKKYEELNKQYEIEKTKRLQEQIRQIKDKEYGTSFSSHLLVTVFFGFIGYIIYNHI
jgi:preprotein translocase subunit Sss1